MVEFCSTSQGEAHKPGRLTGQTNPLNKYYRFTARSLGLLRKVEWSRNFILPDPAFCLEAAVTRAESRSEVAEVNKQIAVAGKNSIRLSKRRRACKETAAEKQRSKQSQSQTSSGRDPESGGRKCLKSSLSPTSPLESPPFARSKQ